MRISYAQPRTRQQQVIHRPVTYRLHSAGAKSPSKRKLKINVALRNTLVHSDSTVTVNNNNSSENKMKTRDEIIAELVDTYRKSSEAIQAQLDVPMLVGAPYLLCAEKDGRTKVYGEWDTLGFDGAKPGEKMRGFRDSDIVPDSLCGTFQFTEESVNRNIAACSRVQQFEPVYFFAMHFRKFLEQRLEKNHEMLTKLQTANL